MHPHIKRDAFWLALFALSASSLVFPFLFVTEPPLLDYPNHLARTFILAHLNDPAFHFSEHYRADWKPYPFILWDVLMVALQQILPVESAGKSPHAHYSATADLRRVVYLASQSHRHQTLTPGVPAFLLCNVFVGIHRISA